MPTKKISRKKLLKEPDEFISTTARLLQFLREHRRKVTLYGVVAIALVAAGLGGHAYFRWQQGKALVIQQQAFKLYPETSNKAANPQTHRAGIK